MKKKSINLLEFKKAIDKAVEKAGSVANKADVEFWLVSDNQDDPAILLYFDGISQFSVKPDVCINLRDEN